MEIRKANKNDLEEFIKVDERQIADYSKIIEKKIKISPKKDTIKEFNRILKSKEEILFVVGKKPIIAYLHGKIHKSFLKKVGNIEFLYVDKKYRRKGIATKLIEEFTNYLNSNKVDEISLKFNIKNINAEKLYKKLGFEKVFITMKRKLK